MGEVRYNSLTRAFPQRAEQLFEKAEKYAEAKYEKFAHMASEEEQFRKVTFRLSLNRTKAA